MTGRKAGLSARRSDRPLAGRRLPGLVPAPALPAHGHGQTIGLLGGSFNPPHAAHRLISLIALRRLGLDAVWWLVTPGNPLKDHKDLPALAVRLGWAKALKQHPRIHVTDLESRIGTRFSIDTLNWLQRRCPRIRFVWLMGSDNLVGFHRWKAWREIAASMPIAVITRPGSELKATHSKAGLALQRHRLHEHAQKSLARRKAPAWIVLHDQRSHLSSTAIRASQRGQTSPHHDFH
jgi:nicotinate-nucleotide adenylyltransferase